MKSRLYQQSAPHISEVEAEVKQALKNSVMGFTDYGAKEVWRAIEPILTNHTQSVLAELEARLPEKVEEEPAQPISEGESALAIAARNYDWGFNKCLEAVREAIEAVREGK